MALMQDATEVHLLMSSGYGYAEWLPGDWLPWPLDAYGFPSAALDLTTTKVCKIFISYVEG